VRFHPTPVAGAFLVELEPQRDERGSFARTFCRNEFARAGLATVVDQVNVAWNRARGTVRGLHYQRPPHAEAKLLRCARGSAFVALVDLRRGSPSLGRPWWVTLDAAGNTQLYVPERVANGYQTLEDGTELLYLMSTAHQPEAAAGIRYDDPRLAIPWPLEVSVVSDRDRALPPLDLDSMAL
jgi:dTDP-4-dehydrorhamnose 3,5-epimerase